MSEAGCVAEEEARAVAGERSERKTVAVKEELLNSRPKQTRFVGDGWNDRVPAYLPTPKASVLKRRP